EAQAKIDEVLIKKNPKTLSRSFNRRMGLFFKANFGRFFQLSTNECLEYYKELRAIHYS
ncbi:unnamed protein product, partial [Rotaria sp. Silwood1]